MTDFLTPAHHSQWQPTDLDFAAQPSGKALEGEDGTLIPLTNGQLYGLTVDLAESAASNAEEALRRIEARSQTSIDLSNADDEPETELDADDLALARWDAGQ